MIAAVNRNYESGRVRLDTVLTAQIHAIKIHARLIKEESRLRILTTKFNGYLIPDKSKV